MDEETAWACFVRTGSVKDYLVYSQCKSSGQAAETMQKLGQEETHADQYGGSGSQ